MSSTAIEIQSILNLQVTAGCISVLKQVLLSSLLPYTHLPSSKYYLVPYYRIPIFLVQSIT